ncbi:hypothetical protein SAMN05216357_11085 [Porphyromonadaceae bacterium KH3CP3RA]|nr:hypothetical protein SAMN05216357_11085 [Porphyromonadaceae bacterium KH3CP3RA]
MPTLLSFHDQQHITRMFVQEQRVNMIFNQFVSAISPEMRKWRDAGNKNSVWVRNPGIEKAIDRYLVQLQSNLENEIKSGQTKAWNEAILKNDKMVEGYIKGMSLSTIVKEGMFKRNIDALELLQNRTENGLNLSQRIWNITGQTKGHIETFLEGGIATGRSADAISRDFRQLLNNPDKRFRRVRNKKGQLVYSQPMKDYHPGRGVYRSAKMNAIRVSATETNMGYRMSDCERWKQLDFVLGFEVKRSRNAHPCAICDSLVGKYPKDFVFSGWHPFCICIAVPIVLEHEDFADFLLTDQKPTNQYVRDIPAKAREWMNAYTKKTGETPFFMRKNQDLLSKPVRKIKYKTPAERYEIQTRWNTRVAGRKYNDQLQGIKAEYGKESAAIDKFITTIKKDIQSGKAVPDIDSLMDELNHKINVKIAWDERVEINRLETLLVDVKGLKSQFSMLEIQSVYGAVETKLATWENLSLNDQIKKLKFEIDWVEKNKKYNTWKVAQDAYKKKFSKVQYLIEKENIQQSVTDSLKFAQTTKSKKVKDLADDLNSLLKSDTPLSQLQQKASALNSEVAKLEAAKASREAKKIMGDAKPVDWTDQGMYSKDRKNKAMWTADPRAADDKVRDVTGLVWRNAKAHEKLSAYRYTAGSSYINEPLRGQNYIGQYYGKYNSQKDIDALTNIVGKSFYNFDIWIQRGVDKSGFRGLFGFDIDDISVNNLKGKIAVEKGFSSCSVIKGGGFDNKPVIYNIYCPRGTKMLYAEPFSAYGGGGVHQHWDGVSKQLSFGGETEMVLQRNTKFRIAKAEYKNGRYYVDLEVIEQP